MVSDHAQIGRTGFGYSVSRHAVHAWKQFGSERVREAPFCDLDISLCSNELSLLFVARGGFCTIIDRRISFFECVGPGPKTVAQPSTDRGDERRIRVVEKQLMKTVDVNGGDDLEKCRVFRDGLAGYRVRKFQRRGWGEGNCSLGPFGYGGGEVCVGVP